MLVKGSIRALPVMLLGLPAAAFGLGLGDIHLLSPLNAPLDAEVELVDAAPDELASLQAQVASKETFARYGLDYPSYLAGVQARTVRTPDGRQVIQLKSAEPIHQPYLTLLVELNWARGRLVREYTMLLDPPVYTPGQPAVADAPVSAPAAGVETETREGAISRDLTGQTSPAAAGLQGAPTETAQAAASPPPEVAPLIPPPAPEPPPVAKAEPPAPAPAAPAPTPAATPAPQPTPTARAEPPAPAPKAERPAARDSEASEPHVVQQGESLSSIASRVAQAGVSAAQTQTWMLAIYRANPHAFDRNMNVLRQGAVLRMPEAGEVSAIPAGQAADEIHRQYTAWRNDAGKAPATAPPAARTRKGELKLVTPSDGASIGADETSTAKSGSGEEGGTTSAESRRLLTMHDADLANMQSRVSGQSGEQASSAPVPAPQSTAVAVDMSASASSQPASAESTAAPAEAPSLPPPTQPLTGRVASFIDQVKDLWWVGVVMVVAFFMVLALRTWRARRQAEFDDSLDQLARAGVGVGSLGLEHGFATGDGGPLGPLEGPEEPFVLEDLDEPRHAPVHTPRLPPPPPARTPVMEDLRSTETTMGFSEGSDPLAEADFHMTFGLYDQAAELLRVAIEHEPGRRDLRLKLLDVYFAAGNVDEFLANAEWLAQTRDEAAHGEWERIVIMGRQMAPDDPLFADITHVPHEGGLDLDLEGGEAPVDFDVLGEEPPEDATLGHPALGGTLGHPQEEEETEFDYVDERPTATRQMTSTLHHFEPEADEFEVEVESEPGEATMVAGFDDHSRRLMEVAAQRRSLGDTYAPDVELELDQDGTPDGHADVWSVEEELDSTLAPGQVLSDADTARLPAFGEEEEFEEFESHEDEEIGIYDPNDPSALESGYGHSAASHEEMALEPVTMSEVGTKLDLARAYIDMGDPEGARNILQEVLLEGSPSQRGEAQRLLESLPG